MTDSYLSISAIANNTFMQERVRSCYAQQTEEDPVQWVWNNRYDWAAAPGWGAAWESALASNITEPGKDPTVITDGMILSQIQSMLASK